MLLLEQRDSSKKINWVPNTFFFLWINKSSTSSCINSKRFSDWIPTQNQTINNGLKHRLITKKSPFYVCMWAQVLQLCPTLCDPVSCSPPGSSVGGISQARILEWVAIFFSRGSSWPRGWTHVSYIADRFFTSWATREAPILRMVIMVLVSRSCLTLSNPMDCILIKWMNNYITKFVEQYIKIMEVNDKTVLWKQRVLMLVRVMMGWYLGR